MSDKALSVIFKIYLKKEAPWAGNRWSREFLVFGCLLFLLFSENVNFPTLVGDWDYHGDNFA